MKNCDLNPWGLPICPMCTSFKVSKNDALKVKKFAKKVLLAKVALNGNVKIKEELSLTPKLSF